MRYLFVDQILEYQRGEHIRGIKNVAMTEDFLEFHFPGNPVMPGVLLLEALSQLAGWLEAASSDFQAWFLLNQVEKCMFYGFAFPGNTIELDVRLQPNQSEFTRRFLGMCMVNNKKKVVAEFVGEVIPMKDIEDIDDRKKHFQILQRKELSFP